jgi:steroid delta-isomerase-like uncharacterized protein
MSIDPHTLLHRWFEEVWNQGREQTIDELFAAGGVGHGLGEGDADVHGPTAFKAFWNNLRAAIPDVRIRIEDTVVQSDKGVARVRLTGTHLGDTLGVPASGRPISIAGIVIVRVSGGQIVEGWNSWDQLGLLQQIGAVPRPKAADRFLAERA